MGRILFFTLLVYHKKVEYANSYIEDMDIETKISVAENSLNLETLKDWLIEQCSEISDEDAYDIKCWAEEVCKYDVDDYMRENLYNLQNDIESIINDYDYINEKTRERFYVYSIIMADEYGRIAQYESSYMAPSDFCYFIEDLKPFDPRYTDFPWYPLEED